MIGERKTIKKRMRRTTRTNTTIVVLIRVLLIGLMYNKKRCMSKYKYYFRKPKSEIAKDIFYTLMTAGAISIAATSPYFIRNLMKGLKLSKKYKKKKMQDTLYILRRKGYIDIVKENKQIYIALTKEGKRKAGWLQINDLKIRRPKKWDRKWRIVIFDISHMRRFYRDAFRGKLKELGFYPLQKSVWVTPFNCQDEVNLLKSFFALKEREVRLITAQKIGEDKKLRKIFKL